MDELKKCYVCGGTKKMDYYSLHIKKWELRCAICGTPDRISDEVNELRGSCDEYDDRLQSVCESSATLAAEVARLRARVAELEAEARWVSVEEGLPEHANKKCEVRCKHKRSNKALVTVAVYVAPRSIRAEDFIDPDYSDSDWEDYEEETDTYWTPSGWYEDQIADAADVNWFLSDDYEITHWRYITPPEADNA